MANSDDEQAQAVLVYVVMTGHYDGSTADVAFMSQEKAQRYVELNGGMIEDVPLDPLFHDPPTVYRSWRVDVKVSDAYCPMGAAELLEGTRDSREDRAYSPCPINSPMWNTVYYQFIVYASSHAEAIGIAQKRRAELMATGKWQLDIAAALSSAYRSRIEWTERSGGVHD